jgi:4-diphosphocytidyl-2-C-methyl-D-erythritol kinase
MRGTQALLVLEAHAKVNLALEVVGRRSDGFHELVSVMQTIGLHDVLRTTPASDLSLTCSIPHLAGPTNLAYRAATLLRERFEVELGCAMHLEKTIPEAAGLGGGSSDAAAALIGLNSLWKLGAGCDDLCQVAQQLGSDVPFFLYAGTSLVRGRGERVRRLETQPSLWYLLANPGTRVRTADVFLALRESEWSNGFEAGTLARRIEEGEPVSPGPNGLHDALFRIEPQARECFNAMQTVAHGCAFVSGSGPTVGAAFATREEAERARDALSDDVGWVCVTSSWNPPAGASPCA